MPGTISTLPAFMVRAARQPDLTTLAEILADSFHHRDGVLGLLYPLFRLGIYEDLKHRFMAQPSRYVCLVAAFYEASGGNPAGGPATDPSSDSQEAGGKIVGTVEMGVRTWSFWYPQARYLYLSNLAVLASHRRQGAARQLLEACEHIAQNWGFYDIYLHVLENNTGAKRLYESMGYTVRRAEPQFGSVLFNQPRQLLLRKQLTF
ncbi:MAG: GNAT family N-acetyltransferase [Synechococcales bacterium]|nr:GNAT family N-acetyltransferase [Synechococcales bacterium]